MISSLVAVSLLEKITPKVHFGCQKHGGPYILDDLKTGTGNRSKLIRFMSITSATQPAKDPAARLVQSWHLEFFSDERLRDFWISRMLAQKFRTSSSRIASRLVSNCMAPLVSRKRRPALKP